MSLDLHGFGDASERAYGACVYVRVLRQDGSWSACMVFSRARVAPLKRVSLLELLGALVCSRLVVQVALKLPEDTVCHGWTDCIVALAWIKSGLHPWKPFVANRVTEIQSLIAPSQWHHVAGKDNPADLLIWAGSVWPLASWSFVSWWWWPLGWVWSVSVWGFLRVWGNCGGREAEESDYWYSTSCGFICSWVSVWHWAL